MFENKILVASDLTESSAAAEVAAIQLAQRLKVQLVILHVIPERSPLGLPEADSDELHERLLAVGENEVPDATRLLVKGSPATAILKTAVDESVDLIVVGTQGRKGIPRAVLGSIAEAVERESKCPVMLVRSEAGLPF